MSPRQVWAIHAQLPRDRMMGKLDMAGAYQLAHAGEEVWQKIQKEI